MDSADARAALFSAFAPPAQPEEADYEQELELLLERTFPVDDSGKLSLILAQGDVDLTEGQAGQVQLQVLQTVGSRGRQIESGTGNRRTLG